MNTITTSFKQQQGSTLIEILVSMFILALGLMALIAMQTRTSIGIKEAENQTVIAQATENLAENMMTNPVLSLKASTTQRDYSHYTGGKTGVTVPVCPGPADKNLADRSTGAAARKTLADIHLKSFADMVCKVTGTEDGTTIDITINENTTGTTAAAGQTLHVSWTMGGSSGKRYTYDYPLDDNL